MVTALEREREQYKNDPEHVRLIDEQLAYYRAQPAPKEITLDSGAVVQDRTEAYLAALRVEKSRYPKRAKEIDKEIEATEAARAKGVQRAVTHVRGVQTATIDHDPED
jgi:hypothetical protein